MSRSIGTGPLQPGPDVAVVRQTEQSLMSHMRIGLKRDIGDGVGPAGKEAMPGEVLLHYIKPLIPPHAQVRVPVCNIARPLHHMMPIAQHRARASF